MVKKDETLEMCIIYRALNKITVKKAYPLPRIGPLVGRRILHQVGFKIKVSLGSSQRRRYLKDHLQNQTRFV